MPFIKEKCQKCGKDAVTTKQYKIGDKLVSMLQCGHFVTTDALTNASLTPEAIRSIEGKKLFPFQCIGVRHFEESGGRWLCADDMGLGKTVQAQAAMALHKECWPFVMIVKSGLKFQWMYETMRWQGEDVMPYVLETSKDDFSPGYDCYIVSMDLLRRNMDTLMKSFKRAKIQTVIIDECQLIKNHESSRAKCIRQLCAEAKYVIALSGTPIKNHAGEYFSILNILQPKMYSTYARFISNECDYYSNGYGNKIGGLRYPEEFKEKTKHFIIRRTREEVLPELPVITRNFNFSDLGKEVDKMYQDEMEKFIDYMDSDSDLGTMQRQSNILAYLSRMRHLTGISKTRPCAEFVESFLDETDRKIVIFVHHHDVAEQLQKRIENSISKHQSEAKAFGIESSDLSNVKVLALAAKLNPEQRDNVVTEFRDNQNARVLIASTLASGEGLNLQFCSDCIMMERQWNPPNEEQAECRFIRIGQTALKVTATYFVAIGTVDEFFSELVEKKRELVTSTLNGVASTTWDESSLIKELAEIVRAKGNKKWSL